MKRTLGALLYFLSGFVPRQRRKVILGAWLGKKFADNPKYLLLYLAKARAELDLVWIGEDRVRAEIPAGARVRFVPRGSFASYREMITAGSCFVTHGFEDLNTYNVMRGAERVYLGHGLAIKHMGTRDRGTPGRIFAAVRRIWRQTYAFTRYAACSAVHRQKLLEENAPWNIEPGQVLDCGQPRCDFLVEHRGAAAHAEWRQRFFSTHGIRPAAKVITYLPTFRDQGQRVFSFARLEPAQRDQLEAVLAQADAVILEKGHFQDLIRQPTEETSRRSERVITLSGKIPVDTQELLLISDVLVTDYSGCYVDFLTLQRPIIHFAYDRKEYENKDRGLYFDLDVVAGGPIVEDFSSLCAELRGSLAGTSNPQSHRDRVSALLVEFERGTAASQVARAVLGD